MRPFATAIRPDATASVYQVYQAANWRGGDVTPRVGCDAGTEYPRLVPRCVSGSTGAEGLEAHEVEHEIPEAQPERGSRGERPGEAGSAPLL
jgi:hypothetical protein